MQSLSFGIDIELVEKGSKAHIVIQALCRQGFMDGATENRKSKGTSQRSSMMKARQAR